MKKILIFNGYYIPAKNYGGPLTSIENLINACHDSFEFYVVSLNHDFNSDTPFEVKINEWIKVGHANVMYLSEGELDYSYSGMLHFIKSVNPSVVWFAGVLVPRKKIIGTFIAKKMHIPVLFSPRGELNEDHVKIKSWKKRPVLALLHMLGIYNNCYFHATGTEEFDGVLKYFKPSKEKVFMVPNIALIKQPQIGKHAKEKGVLKCYFCSRIHPVKNILFVIEAMSLCKASIQYDIYGPIEDPDYWEKCMNRATEIGDNIRIQHKGYLKREDMPKVVQQYDCLLFATTGENYSHTIAESLANSRPVIISKGTTPWDDVDGKAGYAISLETPEKFAEKLDYLASLNENDFDKLIQATSDYFDNSPLVNAAIEGHKKMLNAIIEGNKG